MIRFTLPKPITLSAAFNNAPNRGRIKSREYKEWQRIAMPEIMVQKRGQTIPTPPVQMTLTVPYQGNGDVCNLEKVVTDTLVQMQIIPNDSMKYLRRVILQDGAPPGQCIVEIESLKQTIPHYGKVS